LQTSDDGLGESNLWSESSKMKVKERGEISRLDSSSKMLQNEIFVTGPRGKEVWEVMNGTSTRLWFSKLQCKK
jgi:hypothetical protein